MYKFLKNNKRKIIWASFGLTFLFTLIVVYFYVNISKAIVRNSTKASDSNAQANVEDIDLEGFDPTLPFNVLLVGFGGWGHSGGMLSDTLVVAHIDPSKKKIFLISIPRDLWVQIPVRSDKKEWHKINTAYAIGSDENKYPSKEPQYIGFFGAGNMAKKVVGDTLGLPVEFYISVNFDGLVDLIDAMGGVEVDVPVAFDDYFYPVKGLERESCGKTQAEIAKMSRELSGFELEKQFECRYEHLHFEKGLQLMDGTTALKFVRSRHSSEHGGDFARSVRQMALLDAMKEKLISLGGISVATEILARFGTYIQTDIDEDEMLAIIAANPGIEKYSLERINLSEENVLVSSRSSDGQFILIPKQGLEEGKGIYDFIKSKL